MFTEACVQYRIVFQNQRIAVLRGIQARQVFFSRERGIRRMGQVVRTTPQARIEGKALPVCLLRAQHIKRNAVADLAFVEEHIRTVDHQVVIEAA
ncbi:hypothetical protein D3C86_1899920 [compost metagenome]